MFIEKISTFIEKGHVYRMPLCLVIDEDLALYGSWRSGEYFQTRRGNYYPQANFLTITELLVEKSSKEGYVKELVTGTLIPAVLLTVFPIKEGTGFACSDIGKAKNLAFVFAIVKQSGISFTDQDVNYALQIANNEMIANYILTNDRTKMQATITNTLYLAQNAKNAFEEKERTRKKAEFKRKLGLKKE